MFYEFNGHRPVVDPSAFVHPQAAVTVRKWSTECPRPGRKYSYW